MRRHRSYDYFDKPLKGVGKIRLKIGGKLILCEKSLYLVADNTQKSLHFVARETQKSLHKCESTRESIKTEGREVRHPAMRLAR